MKYLLVVRAFILANFIYVASGCIGGGSAAPCDSGPCARGSCTNTGGTYRCTCPTGWSGSICSVDNNECDTNPCVHGSCHNTQGSFYCTCDQGWEGNLCQTDINECTRSNPCQHGTCRNTPGGYLCICGAGYYGIHCESACMQNCARCSNNATCNVCSEGYEVEEYQCIDANECIGNPYPCVNGTCYNEVGGFRCECFRGYEGALCDRNVDECENTPGICSHGDCIDTHGSYECHCHIGWEQAACDKDINECSHYHPCGEHGTCENTAGSYTCMCDLGYEGVTCTEDSHDCLASPCSHGECFDEPGPAFTCSCDTGYTGDLCDQDIDECRTAPCMHGTCNNTAGSFTCTCDAGWQGSLCEMDTDECVTNDPCIHGSCNNTHGGYECSCDTGYTGIHCTSGCMPNCEDCDDYITCNTCFPGYYYHQFETCRDEDECSDLPCVNGTCHNYDGGYTCECFLGWTGAQCEVDIDECYFDTCEHGNCTNFRGSYECQCHPGYFGKDCDTACPDHCDTCISNTSCIQCMNGYERNNLGMCTNVDECVTHSPCIRGTCSDTEGGYMCNCTGTGYQGDTCQQDLDECNDYPCLYGECTNTVGSYRCACDVGYTGHNCDSDIDECYEYEPCEHGTCKDYDGGYECECGPGWQGTHCDENINECNIAGLCNQGRCEDQDGSYNCSCYGYYSGRHCEYDTNECLGNVCENGECVNLRGSYRCECNEGYYGTKSCLRYPRARLYEHGHEHDPDAISMNASDIWNNHCIRLQEGEMFDINCRKFNRACISPHGFISLGQPYLGFANPKPLSDERSEYLIAALHTFNQGSPTDLQESNVWISTYSIYDGKQATVDMFDRFKNEVNQLDRAANFPKDFEPKFAIIATYNQIRTYPYMENKPKNTFQIALVSDTETGTTLAIIKYEDLRTRVAIPNTAGIQVPGSAQKTKRHAGAGTAYVFRLHVRRGFPVNSAREEQAGEYFYVTNRPEECPARNWENPYKCLKSFHAYNQIQSHAWRSGPSCFCNRYSALRRGSFTHRGSCALAGFSLDGKRYFKECCYRRATRWPTYERWHLFRDILFSNTVYEAEGTNHLNDIASYCCAASVASCNLYKRARDSAAARKHCRGMSCWEIRYANGDPHIITGDGTHYPFQGVGEYVYAQSELFNIQVRMTEYQNSDGEGIGASVISAAVMKAINSNTIQVEANGPDLIITSYPAHPTIPDLTQWFNQADDLDTVTYPGDLIMLTKIEGALAVKFMEAETELYIQSGGFGDLSIALTVTEGAPMFTTQGLIGPMNGDPSDDFMTPDNVTLAANSTEETLYFELGQKWLVNQHNTDASIFIYPPDMMSSDFTAPPGYEPRFHLLANQTEDRRAEIDLTCGNSVACRYDLAATEDEEFAEKRLEFEQLIANLQALSNFEQPQIHVPSQVHATVGEELEFTVTVVGADNDTFEFLTYLPDDAEFSYGTVRWPPQNRDPVYGLTFGGSGSSGYPALMETVGVLLCDCSGHGDCAFDYLQPTEFDNDTFALVHCDCNRGYTGDFCESEVDACADDPCVAGSQCTDMSAEEEQATGRAFLCSGCPVGYRQLGGFCVEVDECEEAALQNETLCNPPEVSQCINHIGSYECVCNSGYMMDTINDVCIDKNECTLHEHSCTQLCINTAGSYRCGCVENYVLQDDGRTCSADPNAVTPCLESNLCSDYCATDTQCGCRIGMSLVDQHNCMYNQECVLGTHDCGANSVCVYNFPGYRCECSAGYNLNDDSRTCTECRPGFWGGECEGHCSCATPTTPCLPATGCVECPTGWTGGSCSEDIDECSDNPVLCGDHGNCTNSVGTYRCECEEGYGWNTGDTQCTYINYCELMAVNGNEACQNGGVCVHQLGGFHCNCTAGYMGEQCQIEVDECSSNPCLNDGYCQDQFGSYVCICELGFTGQNCEEDIDECLSSPCLNGGLCVDQPGSFDCQCPYPWSEFRCLELDACHSNPCVNSGTCIDLPGTYQCVCTSGWEGEQCQINIDECFLDTDGCAHICTDTDGSYECSCRHRYELGEDLRSCIADDICVPNGVYCDEDQGYCIDGHSCYCNHGYTLIEDNVCIDTDECATNTHRCDEHGDCINEVGGYRCRCHEGYALQNNRRTCMMIDWCVEPTPVNKCLPGAQCVPEVGGFSCVCLPGLTGEYCEIDIDNCLSDPCYNGAYCEDGRRDSVFCSCRLGFYGDLCDGDYDECRSNPCQNQGICEDLPGGYKCICLKGFTGANCENDLRECDYSPCIHGTCIDMVGGYQCSCDQLYGGTHCDHEPCASDPCHGNGLCYIERGENNEHKCECGALYEGDSCETEIDLESLETTTKTLFMKLSGTFTEDLRNRSSTHYKDLTRKIKPALKNLLLQHIPKDYVDVNYFRYEPGSINAVCDIVLLQSTAVTEELIVDTVQYVVDKNDGVLPGMEEYKVLEVKKYESKTTSSSILWLAVGLPLTVILIICCILSVCYVVQKCKAGQQRVGSTTQLVVKEKSRNTPEPQSAHINPPVIWTVEPAKAKPHVPPLERCQSPEQAQMSSERKQSVVSSVGRPESQASGRSMAVSLSGVTFGQRKNSKAVGDSRRSSEAVAELE